MVISCGKATMAELSSVLSVEDLHDIVEIIRVDSYNAAVIRKSQET